MDQPKPNLEGDQAPQQSDFAQQARGKRRGLLADFWSFLGQNKKWWLLPILIVILLLGVLVLISSTAVAPFIYTLF